MGALKLPVAALLLSLISLAAAHGADMDGSMNMDGMNSATKMNSTMLNATNGQAQGSWDPPSYAGLDSYSRTMLAHVILEILAWFFVLPIGSQPFVLEDSTC